MINCFICREDLKKSIGHYNFTYLLETIQLCGHCAQQIMTYAKELQYYEDYEKASQIALEKEKDL